MNYRELADDLIKWTKKWFIDNQKEYSKAIVGVGSGLKSYLALELMRKSLGQERVIGIIMRDDKDDALDIDGVYACKNLGIKFYQLPIYPSVNALKNVMNLECKIKLTEQTVKNLPARMRNAALYAMAQSLNGIVINTSCLSDNYIGNVTKWGDSCGDISPFGNLTLEELVGIATEWYVPQRIIFKSPNDELPGSKPDEERLGFTYLTLDKYIRTGMIDSPSDQEQINRLYRQNRFKMRPIESFEPELSIHLPE